MKIFIALLSMVYFSATAAEIRTKQLPGTDTKLITISGPIEYLDANRFINYTANIRKAVILLDSTGGSVIDGINIGRNIRSRGFFTAVPDYTLCASSCALIWLAGKERFAEDTSFLGFHAAYIYKNGKATEKGAANALIGSYLNDLGLSDQAIVFVTSAPPEGIERLNRRKAEILGISYNSVNDFKTAEDSISTLNASSLRTKAGIATQAYDPVTTVTRFYRALSLADANSASALVVPEKRGIGPFNERNIATFFGAMIEPLSINSVEKISTDTVQVRYQYRVNKTQCNGIATVRTQYILGNTLIQSIRANC